jgi:hypothetical protein
MRWSPLLVACAALATFVTVRIASVPDFHTAVRTLLDGAPDRTERLRLLRVVAAEGAALARGGELQAQTIAAAAAIALDDGRAYERIVALHGGLAPLRPGAPAPPPGQRDALAAVAALGEPWLRPLLVAAALESGGDRAGASALYRMAEEGALLARRHTPAGTVEEHRLAVELARAGRERCR